MALTLDSVKILWGLVESSEENMPVFKISACVYRLDNLVSPFLHTEIMVERARLAEENFLDIYRTAIHTVAETLVAWNKENPNDPRS